MKVKELIEALKHQDPEKEVMIQQGEDYDYTTVHSVKVKQLTDLEEIEEDAVKICVVIEYC